MSLVRALRAGVAVRRRAGRAREPPRRDYPLSLTSTAADALEPRRFLPCHPRASVDSLGFRDCHFGISYSRITWGNGIANQLVPGFLVPVRQGRVKEVIKQVDCDEKIGVRSSSGRFRRGAALHGETRVDGPGEVLG